MSGNDVFVSDLGNRTVTAYNGTSGAPDPAFTTIPVNQPYAMAVLGNDLYVSVYPPAGPTGWVGQYDAGGSECKVTVQSRDQGGVEDGSGGLCRSGSRKVVRVK